MKRLISALSVIIFAISLAFFFTSCADNPVGLSTGKPGIINRIFIFNLHQTCKEQNLYIGLAKIVPKSGIEPKVVEN